MSSDHQSAPAGEDGETVEGSKQCKFIDISHSVLRAFVNSTINEKFLL